jgi:Fe-S cluster assembly protein SufD
MIDVMDAKELFLSHFTEHEKELGEFSGDGLRSLRSSAMERFAELGFPTTSDEEWRFTPLGALAEVPFQPAAAHVPELDPGDLRRLLPATGPARKVVMVNGQLVLGLSDFGVAQHQFNAQIDRNGEDATVCSLARPVEDLDEVLRSHLARYARFDDAPFVALNTAFLRDGILVYLPRGTVLRQPLHLVYVTCDDGEPVVSHPRTLVVCECNTQATIVQSYLSAGNDVHFTNAVSEFVLGENAFVDHCKLQRERKQAIHFETLQLQLGRGSNFASQAITLGGGLVRNNINAVLGGEGCECTLNGLYVAGGQQIVDNHTRIDHAKPHGASHELYKGILDGKSRGVFNGKIFVHQDAQKTDAKQTNKTLLLSEDATINAMPQLEIFADDVKCTHGATVGQLAGDAIFYLRTRGLGAEQARSLLTFAFANDILRHIKVEPLRRELEDFFLAAQQLPAEARLEETL